MTDTSKTAKNHKIIKNHKKMISPSHHLTVNVMLNNINFLWFLLCSKCQSMRVAINSKSHWPSTSAVCHSAEVGHTALSIEQFRSSALFCGGPVDLEFAARQSSWPKTESWHFQTLVEDILFCKMFTTKHAKHIRDFFQYVLHKFTLYSLTYFTTRLVYT